MPNSCHKQYYDRSMFYPAQSSSEGCSPKMRTDEVNEEGHLGGFRGSGAGVRDLCFRSRVLFSGPGFRAQGFRLTVHACGFKMFGLPSPQTRENLGGETHPLPSEEGATRKVLMTSLRGTSGPNFQEETCHFQSRLTKVIHLRFKSVP